MTESNQPVRLVAGFQTRFSPSFRYRQVIKGKEDVVSKV